MKIKTIILTGLFFCIAFTANAVSETVKFEGETPGGKPLELTGELMKPEKNGRFPAIVLLHGCGGMHSEQTDNVHASKAYKVWASRLNSWGYVTLQVDSFRPRDVTSVCDRPGRVDSFDRTLDAFAGKAYLASLPYVDENRIAIMGWSHGGWSTLTAVDKDATARVMPDPFKAAVAIYPMCQREIHLKSPLLILIGQNDDWTPRLSMRRYEIRTKNGKRIEFKNISWRIPWV